MTADKLLQLEEQQIEYIQKNSDSVLKKGIIETASDLYPDVNIPDNVAFGRGELPLAYLLLLYEKVALFIPPIPKQFLELRWKVKYEFVLELIERNFIQPFIGNPNAYTADHFEALFKLCPNIPSVWCRGKGLLDAMGMGDKLDERACPLPIEQIALLPEVRNRGRFKSFNGTKDELTSLIKKDLLVDYADLHIFGDGIIADSLIELKNPSQIAQKLLYLNDIRTYPILFGLGGSPNYDIPTLISNPSLLLDIEQDRKTSTLIVPEDLDQLLRGVNFKIDNLDMKTLFDFHSSELGLSLRKALSEFEKNAKKNIDDYSTDNLSKVLLFAKNLQTILHEVKSELNTPSKIVKIRKTQKFVDDTFETIIQPGQVAIGLMVLGTALGLDLKESTFTSLLGSAVAKSVKEKLKDKVKFTALSLNYSPSIAHLWKIYERK
jgi:hypothetical protein